MEEWNNIVKFGSTIQTVWERGHGYDILMKENTVPIIAECSIINAVPANDNFSVRYYISGIVWGSTIIWFFPMWI